MGKSMGDLYLQPWKWWASFPTTCQWLDLTTRETVVQVNGIQIVVHALAAHLKTLLLIFRKIRTCSGCKSTVIKDTIEYGNNLLDEGSSLLIYILVQAP